MVPLFAVILPKSIDISEFRFLYLENGIITIGFVLLPSIAVERENELQGTALILAF